MITVEINIDPDLLAKLSPKRLDAAMKRSLGLTKPKIRNMLSRAYSRTEANGRGPWRRIMHTRFKVSPVISGTGSHTVVITNSAEGNNGYRYWSAQEEGLRPGTWPDKKRLTDWVRTKLRANVREMVASGQRVDTNNAALKAHGYSRPGRRKQAMTEEKAASTLAFLIARSINKKGIEGRDLMTALRPRIQTEVTSTVRRSVRRFLQNPRG